MRQQQCGEEARRTDGCCGTDKGRPAGGGQTSGEAVESHGCVFELVGVLILFDWKL